MTNKGLAFSLGGVKKVQNVKARRGLNKPFKASALSVFETPEEGSAKEDVQQTKRQRLEPAGCCAFPVMLLLSPERMLWLSAPDSGCNQLSDLCAELPVQLLPALALLPIRKWKKWQ